MLFIPLIFRSSYEDFFLIKSDLCRLSLNYKFGEISTR
jgi:hypothetical protein